MPDSASSPVAADRDTLRDTLAQDNSALARIGPILLHLLATPDHSLFSDEIVARIRGMCHHLAWQVLRAQADEDPDAGERWLEEEGRRFETSIIDAMKKALAERGGAGNANAFIRRYRWQQRYYEITEELADDSSTIIVQMPGEIVGHNADDREGNHVMWNFSGEMMRDRELELMVTARMR